MAHHLKIPNDKLSALQDLHKEKNEISFKGPKSTLKAQAKNDITLKKIRIKIT